MKAITLTQPWASLVAVGAKTVETRSWGTSYRGPLAIHAAKGWPGWAKQFCRTSPAKDMLALRIDWQTLEAHRGCVIAVCHLASILPTEDARISPMERCLGDFTPGRVAWLLENIEPCVPTPARGSLGLWEWPDELLQMEGV